MVDLGDLLSSWSLEELDETGLGEEEKGFQHESPPKITTFWWSKKVKCSPVFHSGIKADFHQTQGIFGQMGSIRRNIKIGK